MPQDRKQTGNGSEVGQANTGNRWMPSKSFGSLLKFAMTIGLGRSSNNNTRQSPWSVKELSAATGISERSIGNWRADRTPISPDSLETLLRILLENVDQALKWRRQFVFARYLTFFDTGSAKAGPVKDAVNELMSIIFERPIEDAWSIYRQFSTADQNEPLFGLNMCFELLSSGIDVQHIPDIQSRLGGAMAELEKGIEEIANGAPNIKADSSSYLAALKSGEFDSAEVACRKIYMLAKEKKEFAANREANFLSELARIKIARGAFLDAIHTYTAAANVEGLNKLTSIDFWLVALEFQIFYGEVFGSHNQIERVIFCIESLVIPLSEKIGSGHKIGEIYLLLGRGYLASGYRSNKLPELEMACKTLAMAESKARRRHICIAVSIDYARARYYCGVRGRNTDVLWGVIESYRSLWQRDDLEINDQLLLLRTAGLVYCSIGEINEDVGPIRKAIAILRCGIRHLGGLAQSFDRARLYNNLAMAELSVGDITGSPGNFRRAIISISKAIEIYQPDLFPVHRLDALHNKANAKLLLYEHFGSKQALLDALGLYRTVINEQGPCHDDSVDHLIRIGNFAVAQFYQSKDSPDEELKISSFYKIKEVANKMKISGHIHFYKYYKEKIKSFEI